MQRGSRGPKTGGEGRQAIRTERVEVAYDAGGGVTVAVAGVSLEVGVGEWVGLIGPNGSEKSTLVRAISRVLALRGGWPS